MTWSIMRRGREGETVRERLVSVHKATCGAEQR